MSKTINLQRDMLPKKTKITITTRFNRAQSIFLLHGMFKQHFYRTFIAL